MRYGVKVAMAGNLENSVSTPVRALAPIFLKRTNAPGRRFRFNHALRKCAASLRFRLRRHIARLISPSPESIRGKNTNLLNEQTVSPAGYYVPDQ